MLSLLNIISLIYIITPYRTIGNINDNNINNFKQPKLIFFTGGNSLMPEDLYSSFIRKLKNEYDVEVIKNKYNRKNDNKISVNLLSKLYEYSVGGPIIPIGHSSGCSTLINYCSRLNNIEKCILLDPVKNNIEDNEINYDKFKSVLQINAEKSYKWKYNSGFDLFKNPLPKVPFIPAFNMESNKFKNITKIDVLDYGHCDILDTAFSNIMHRSFAEGNEDRESLDNYKNFLISLIDIYCKDFSLLEINKELIQNTYNIEYKII